MTQAGTKSRFNAKLLRPATPGSDDSWTFLILPKDASERLPRRGRTTVDGAINGHRFQSTLEPDGQLSDWLRVDRQLREAAGAQAGGGVVLEIMPVARAPEPDTARRPGRAHSPPPAGANTLAGSCTTVMFFRSPLYKSAYFS
ncbi:DUF1905 domain-containing protein [Massilia glaciei]|uniref:DUF1905 domain-containing protein n=1 Tax=Massilia glaciei TaxID=1524097 RepID=A0A2U2I599_9BURK|nr:DUF1905 domain-containing protein [Massilia glaciei]PWF54931.1 DUF1905 domain-containing protein [Massilia glaciei]